jgi:D-amino-acid dehydrogenase
MRAIIIGGGIIGLSSAYYLQKSGWNVTVLDNSEVNINCSYGNLGMIVPSHFVPLASPGIVAQGLRWMLNSKSPFYVRPSLNFDLLSWGLKFIKHANVQHVEKAAQPLLQLNLYSKKLYEELNNQTGFDFGLEKKGILMYYKTEKVAEEESHLADKAQKMGVDAVVLNKQQVQQMEPETELDILGAVHYRCDAHLYPNQLMSQLLQHLQSSGVEVLTKEPVKKIIAESGRIKKLVSSKTEYEADAVVIANGAWLGELTKQIGLNIPLMHGKGYSFTYDQPEKKLNIPAILCEARVAITPMNGSMRYGGTMEIGAPNNKINLKRVQGIVEPVSKYFPSIRLDIPEEKNIWYGFRPCSPDGLPYIGQSKKINNLFIAGGHSMMGMSLGPATGKIISELINDQKTEVDITAFDPERYS